MQHFVFFLQAFLSLYASAASAPGAMVERRIWIETAIGHIKEDMCKDNMKAWRCLFEREKCPRAMENAFASCNPNVIPDLPEYIDSDESKERADKVVKDCMTSVLVKKYIAVLTKDKMDEYKVCTGVMARQKPLNPNIQKALDASKALAAPHCANGTYFRKCFSISDKECNNSLAKHHLDCSMKMEADGVKVNGDDTSVQEAAGMISECGRAAMRTEFVVNKKSGGKDCE